MHPSWVLFLGPLASFAVQIQATTHPPCTYGSLDLFSPHKWREMLLSIMSLQPLTSLNPSITQDSAPYRHFQHHNSNPHNNIQHPPHHTARELLSPPADGAGHDDRVTSCRVLRPYVYGNGCTSLERLMCQTWVSRPSVARMDVG